MRMPQYKMNKNSWTSIIFCRSNYYKSKLTINKKQHIYIQLLIKIRIQINMFIINEKIQFTP